MEKQSSVGRFLASHAVPLREKERHRGNEKWVTIGSSVRVAGTRGVGYIEEETADGAWIRVGSRRDGTMLFPWDALTSLDGRPVRSAAQTEQQPPPVKFDDPDETTPLDPDQMSGVMEEFTDTDQQEELEEEILGKEMDLSTSARMPLQGTWGAHGGGEEPAIHLAHPNRHFRLAEKIEMECRDCGKKFKSNNTFEPKCPKCGSYDVGLA
jgi:hypothetical protein